jgi:hypothetical protein
MATARPTGAAPAQPVPQPAKAGPKGKRDIPSRGAMRSERAGTADRVVPTTGRIKVRATQVGYYDIKRRREGDVFFINGPHEFSKRWMEIADKGEQLRETGAQAALDKRHDEILGGVAERQAPREDDDDITQ